MIFVAAAGVGYTQIRGGWAGAQGTGSGTPPVTIASLGGATVDAGLDSVSKILPSTNADNAIYQAATLRVTITSQLRVYLVQFMSGATPANARFQTFVYAEKIAD